MTLYIKNMVCNRCVMVIKSELEKLGIALQSVNLGEVETSQNLSTEQKIAVAERLKSFGFELIDDKKSRTIEKIKNLIIELVQVHNAYLETNLSDYVALHLNQDYSSLSHLFSEVEGSTIEKFFISQKIEKVKELLTYDELSLNEIALSLHYSSTAYLSNQFKKVTGFTPSHYKQIKENKRRSLDEV